MPDASEPTTTELLDAILALHAFTERGFGILDAKIDSVDQRLGRTIESLRYDMNRRFDRVDDRFDRIEGRIDKLENAHGSL